MFKSSTYKKLAVAGFLIAALLAANIVRQFYELKNIRLTESVDDKKRVEVMLDLIIDMVEKTGIQFMIFVMAFYFGIACMRAFTFKSRMEKNKDHA